MSNFDNETSNTNDSVTSLESETLLLQIPDPLINIPAIRFLCYCFYLIIFIIGLCGNAIVCYVVFRNKAMITVTNLFIVNLALSDILLSFFATFFTPMYIFMQEWILGATLCYIIPYAQGVSVYVSSLTLMTIALDRYFALVYPYFRRLSIKYCLLIILLIWIMAALLTLPYGLFMTLKANKIGKQICTETWPSESFKQSFVSITTTAQFLIPFLVIAFCYARIFFKLKERARNKPGTISEERMKEEEKRTERINRMLISMVVIFVLSWLPINICNMVVDFYPPAKNWIDLHTVFIVTHMVAMSSACYNPILYAWLNENFKQEFRNLLHSLKQLIVCHEFDSANILESANQQQVEPQPGCSTQNPNELITPLTHEIITSVKYNHDSNTVCMRKESKHEIKGKHITPV